MAQDPTVFLFDIDGTLISTGGAGRRAMATAFGAVCDAPGALDGVKLGGMTDRLILRAGFEAIGRTFSEELFTSVMDEYLKHLTHEVKASEGYVVYEGVHEAVEACRAIPDSATGLGTGNIEAGARIKLKRSGLDQHFAFGGFGSDAEDRAELVEAGARRGAKALGVPREEARVVIIGDTPRDVYAAHAIGARCICVATGTFSFEELEAASADAVFETLASPGAVEAIIAA